MWDIPRADTAAERGGNPGISGAGSFLPGLATSQPVVNEFTRYPGHPATVALNTVFPTFTRQDIAAIVPRISCTGSNGALAGSQGGAMLTSNTLASGAITPDADRLYASVDELLFSGTFQNGSRQQNAISVPPGSISRDKLEQSRFFLTASSRAPDLNVFGQPRVAIWPISSQILTTTGNTYCTAWDRLIAFCTTIGVSGSSGFKQYYFQRQPTSPVPPATGPPAMGSASATADYLNITRNQQLYSYLENMTNQAIPGFANTSGGFLTKYGNDRDQILTEIFDYIRCTNLTDLNVTTGFTGTPAGTAGIGSGVVAPIQITSPLGVSTKGLGRFPTLMEAAIDFYVDTATSSVSKSGTTTLPLTMKAIFLPKLFNPMHGFSPPMTYIDESAAFSTGSNDWNVTIGVGGSNQSLNFPVVTATNQIIWAGNDEYGCRPWGGEQLFSEQFINTDNATDSNPSFKQLGWAGSLNQYPFCSSTSAGVTITGTANTFGFTGGTVTFTLAYHGQPPVQTIKLTFPPVSASAAWPLPLVSATNPGQYSAYPPPAGGVYNQRISGMNTATNQPHPWWIDLIDPNDTVKALEAVGPTFQTTPQAPYGDLRLVALETGTDTTSFQPHLLYSNTSYSSIDLSISAQLLLSMAHGLRAPGGGAYPGARSGQLTGPLSTNVNNPYYINPTPAIAYGIVDVTGSNLTITGTKGPRKFAGDWDNGIGYWPDGPYANKPDEGDIYDTAAGSILQPYFQEGIAHTSSQSFSPLYYSPNRQIASAVMFGSLPSRALLSGTLPPQPWQTLLFHPDPTGLHPGLNPPTDHLFLDLFTMPVVEPYAISEPFSTAGKINLNCQIMPFGTSIVRETGLFSVFESTWIMAIPLGDIGSAEYKGTTNDITNQTGGTTSYPGGPPFTFPKNYRFPIDPGATMTEFESRFNNPSDPNYNRNFVSASEICDVDLYPGSIKNGTTPPSGSTLTPAIPALGFNGTAQAQAQLATYWNVTNSLTGANSRDVPYNHIYPLVTTKSNTFTVHMRVQTLKQVPAGRSSTASWATWTEGHDQVTGEYRGSTTIERYINPNDTRFTSGAINPDNQSMDPAYRFRVVGVKQFVPQ
jgi:uncharacterized protein (TIGR02600 family)